LAQHATEYDVILTTYDMAKVPSLQSLYQRVYFNYLILDEGHKIKGHQTQISQAVRKIHRGSALILTGTPLQNNLVELWSLLNFMYPDIFTTSEPFQKHFDLNENVIDKDFLRKTQKLLELFMLRRLKKEVEKLMPLKLETKVYCPLSKTQVFWYKALLMKDVGSLANMDGATQLGANRHALLRSLFMQLRKCCNHPFVFEGAEMDPNQTTLEDLVAASGKLSVLDMLLQSLSKKKNRAVLFSQFTSMLDLVEDYCVARGWKFCRLDGNTDRARRNYLINRFNEPNSPYFLFLISTRSGGMGLNLQTADTCILFDSDWNPQSDIQAVS
jgi:SWI/SNF-related matrix-associated actin-dependent regulator of chromatin subfamily A member 5